MESNYIKWFEKITVKDIPIVGGKNASLGEMISNLKSKNISVPNGYATTATSYWKFVEHNNLKDKIRLLISDWKSKKASLQTTGKLIRKLILQSKFPKEIEDIICSAYNKLSEIYNKKDVDVAIRSSATAEDLPEASFAGQLESFLNVKGSKELIKKCLQC